MKNLDLLVNYLVLMEMVLRLHNNELRNKLFDNYKAEALFILRQEEKNILKDADEYEAAHQLFNELLRRAAMMQMPKVHSTFIAPDVDQFISKMLNDKEEG